MSPVRALAFGDLDDGLWGAAWSDSAGGPLSVAVGAGSAAEVLTATLSTADSAHEASAATPSNADEGAEWRVEGDRIELVLSPSIQPEGDGWPSAQRAGDGQPPAQPAGRGARAALGGFDQLCRASGRVTLGDAEVEVDAPGWRSTRDGQLELDQIESFRQVAAWFGPHEGLALVALRPRGARGQDADLVAASVLELDQAARVDDPRLSTTYTTAGAPVRAGLEIWLAAQASEADGEHEALPRRAAGAATAPGLEWEAAGFMLHAAPLRWHSKGEDGAGVYLLGRRA